VLDVIGNDSHSYVSKTLPSGTHALEISNLRVQIDAATPVRDVSLAVAPASIHCLVGESGSGKTLTSLASVGLLPGHASASGSIRLRGVNDDLLTISATEWSSIRGSSIGYVGQNALGCLHPAFRIEAQVMEAIRRHRSMPKAEARAQAIEALEAVDLADSKRVARAYPAHLSGGMCQRVALAIALCNRPTILIADEPTTALDDDTQQRIMGLLRDYVDQHQLSILLITHDHDVVREMADEVTSIASGVSTPAAPPVPSAAVRSTASNACGAELDRVAEMPALDIRGVAKTYQSRGLARSDTTVLKNVSLSAPQGSTVGLVGRSGTGKTTLAQIVAGILPPTEGTVTIGGRPITGSERVGRVEKAGLVQYVFQDPFGSLNPRRSALVQVAEPLVAAGEGTEQATERARALLADLGLTAAQVERRPTTLSGGQCQRVGIARALIRKPVVVVLDEPVSALDWSIRADILDQLDELQQMTDATYLLISHDLSLITRECDEIFTVTEHTVRRL